VHDPVGLLRQTLDYLSALTWLALLASTIGGVGMRISFLTPAIRSWNRMSILIGLFALAGLGLAADGALHTRGNSTAGNGPGRGSKAHHWALPFAAVVTLILGVADQSSTLARMRVDPRFADANLLCEPTNRRCRSAP
jgi:hypothetical protein